MKFSRLLGVALLASMPFVSRAQQPDAGRILDQLKQAPAISVPKPPATRIEEKPRATVPSSGERFQVSRFQFRGNAAFSEPVLLALIAEGQGKSMTLGELNDLAERITRHYRDNGYILARAVIPSQDVTEGTVRIDVLEGLLGDIQISNPTGLSDSALAPLRQLRKGQALNRESLESAMLTIADLPGVDVRSTLRPGTAIGASDLLVDVAPGRRFSGGVDMDNFGSRATGGMRVGANFSFNNPLNLGDQIGLGFQTTEERLRYMRLSYQLPVGPYGTRLGVSHSDLHYRLGNDFAALNAEGDATVTSLSATHPLLRSRATTVFASFQHNEKRLIDRVGATRTETSKKPSTNAVGVTANLLDGFWGGGSTYINANYNFGKISLDPTTAALDAASAKTQGNFGSTTLSMQRTQNLSGNLGLFASLNTQIAQKNLDSSEKFSLGGANGVRAYPQGEGSGDEGRQFTGELRWGFAPQWQAQAFYDHGQVKVNKNQFAAGANLRHIWGYGLGLAHNNGSNLQVRGFLAWRGGEQRSVSDVDRLPRVWVQARYFF
ncbi:MAG: ShlB/FhaC/HecB family hemolysin secretion/activation protein [Burkholderiales bacterium]